MSYKDNKEITVIKIYLRNLKKPIVIETDKPKREFIENFIDELSREAIIHIGPVVFSVDEFMYFTYE